MIANANANANADADANVPGATLSVLSVSSVPVSPIAQPQPQPQHHPPPPPQSQPPQPRHHRVRGLSFLRRPRPSTPSPPVSPPERATLERATSYPLNNTPTPAPAPNRDSADSEHSITTSRPNANSNTSTTLAPDSSSSSSSSMARIRRAFSSQNGTSPQQHTSASAPQHHHTPATPATPASPSPRMDSQSRSTNTNTNTSAAQHGTLANSTDGATASTGGRDGLAPDQMPTIKFIPHQDPRASKPSLAFASTSRTLPHEDCVIRVGRYSERDGVQNPPQGVPSAAPVGFKSKVVSRKHCEFWCSQGQWYIKDVKSSSGTFLNHIRLSQPNSESRPFPINDGDVVQLGIDFKGGEEAIFRCVKIRIECNRNWQKKLNDFNMNTHKRLRELNKPSTESNGKNSTECAICLMAIAPCQSLFMAPCSHIWHYKCIHPMLNDAKMYPQFVCPNCRAVTDLEADIEDTIEWNPDNENDSDEIEQAVEEAQLDGIAKAPAPAAAAELPSVDREGTPGLANNLAAMELGDTSIDATLHSSTQPVEVPGSSAQHLGTPGRGPNGTEAELDGRDGPLTPRNDAGPFVFDGSAGRASGRRIPAIGEGQERAAAAGAENQLNGAGAGAS